MQKKEIVYLLYDGFYIQINVILLVCSFVSFQFVSVLLHMYVILTVRTNNTAQKIKCACSLASHCFIQTVL